MEENEIIDNFKNSTRPTMAKPKDTLVWSIIITVLCCLPLGIPAILFSCKVDKLWKKGDYNGAIEAHKRAKRLIILSFLAWFLYLCFLFFAISIADMYDWIDID